ncbi:hypothetical protein TWF730_002533 [Orbilia blumenaviensis]|uniref:Uncharacterized protein n=1 Tax=Orbilia blumenaviensis TaxID=1796055 RepID=A0AAV9UEN5_9PEZI
MGRSSAKFAEKIISFIRKAVGGNKVVMESGESSRSAALKTPESITTKSPWNIWSKSPTMTPAEAEGRLQILNTLVSAGIPFVVWGLEALACNRVPTHFQDPLEVLVPKRFLRQAVKAITEDENSFYHRVEPFDHVDDYIFPREISIVVRERLLSCEYLQAKKTLARFQPWQILLIPERIFRFQTEEKDSIGHLYRVGKLPLYCRLKGTLADIKVPTFFGMLNALYETIDHRCYGEKGDEMRAELENQAKLLIMWRVGRDPEAEIYKSIEDLSQDLRDIRFGLYPCNRCSFDSRYLSRGV